MRTKHERIIRRLKRLIGRILFLSSFLALMIILAIISWIGNFSKVDFWSQECKEILTSWLAALVPLIGLSIVFKRPVISELEKIFDAEETDASRQWKGYEKVLPRLVGDWIQYIPDRESEHCRFSIVSFVKRDDKHVIEGCNMFDDGREHYHFYTLKLLPPTPEDPEDDYTLSFYYFYERRKGLRHRNSRGMGKIRARLVDVKNLDSFEFTDGFFVNEEEGCRVKHTYMVRAKTVLGCIKDLPFQDINSREQYRALFERWISERRPEEWKAHVERLIEENEQIRRKENAEDEQRKRSDRLF